MATKKTVTTHSSRKKETALEKAIAEYKKKIEKTLSDNDMDAGFLSLQIHTAALMFAKIDQVISVMTAPDYNPIVVGVNGMECMHPAEKLLAQYQMKAQSALRALGLNRDSKPIKPAAGHEDSLNTFLSHMSDDNQ